MRRLALVAVARRARRSGRRERRDDDDHDARQVLHPPRATMVAGDVVVFRNADLVTHDVRIGGGRSTPARSAASASWSQQIDQPGGYPFVCTLHPFMSGNLEVLTATLAAAPDGVIAGEPLTLSGRAAAGTARLGIEQSVAGGEWAAVGGGAAPSPDGSFTTTVPAVEGASYRITTPAGASPAVTPRVTASSTSSSRSSAGRATSTYACARRLRRRASPPRWSSTRAGTSAGAPRAACGSTRAAAPPSGCRHRAGRSRASR